MMCRTGPLFDVPLEPRRAHPRALIGLVMHGRYRLESLLAEGGMGLLFAATDLIRQRRVVLKFLHPDHTRTEGMRARMQFEASVLANLAHPNIVAIHDFGWMLQRIPYISMEYVAGVTVGDAITHQGPLPYHRILNIALQLADAMRAIHATGVIHRDLKPTNVMIEHDDVVKLIDFGIAKPLVEKRAPYGSWLTSPGLMVGSVRYMAPEQLFDDAFDQRTDIYSFGLVMYEMATGVLPFADSSVMELLRVHVMNEIPPIRSIGYARSCPPDIEQVIMRCLAKEPTARYGDAELIVSDLAKIASRRLRSIERTCRI